MITLALSGADNTGKTKQLGLLARRIGPAAASSGPLDAHDARWEASKENGMSRWWFATGPTQEVAEVLATSWLQRSHRSGAGGTAADGQLGLPVALERFLLAV